MTTVQLLIIIGRDIVNYFDAFLAEHWHVRLLRGNDYCKGSQTTEITSTKHTVISVIIFCANAWENLRNAEFFSSLSAWGKRLARTHRGVRVHVSVRVEHGEDVPVVVLSYVPDIRVLAGQKLVQHVHDEGRRDPFPGVVTTLDEHAGIVRLEGQLDALDLPSLVCPATHDNLHLVGVLLGQVVQVLVDLVESVVAGEVERFRSGMGHRRPVDQLLHVLDFDVVRNTGLPHYLVELAQLVGGYHEVGRSAHVARRLPEGELRE